MSKPLKATSPYAVRINAMFRRKSGIWAEKEVKSFKKLHFAEEEFAMVERMYRVLGPPRDGNILRRQLYTFLNNYMGEVDIARAWSEQSAAKARCMAPRKIIPLPTPPEQEMTEAERAQAEADFMKLTGRKLNLEREAR